MNKLQKIIILICCFVTMMLTIAGCNNKTETVNNNELRVALADNVRGFDPSSSGYTSGIWDIYSLLYDRLVMEDSNKEIVPQLAESWEVSDDGLIWIFHLQRDIKFSNGLQLDANVVKSSFEFLKEKSVCPVPLTKKVESIQVVDKNTLKFTLDRPYAPFLADLTDMRYPVIAFKDGQAVGTGPYILKEWNKEGEVVLVKNPGYWKGVPGIEKIIFKVIPDPHTRILALEAGDIDLISNYGSSNYSELPRLKKNAGIAVNAVHNWKVGYHLVINCKEGILNDERIRKAVSHAINTEDIKQSIIGDYGITGAAHLSPFSPFAAPDIKGYDYKPEVAQKFLLEAGWKDNNNDGVLEKDGQPCHLKLVITKDDIASIAEIVQNQLQKIGVQTEIQVLERGAQQKAIKEGDFDLVIFTRKYCSGADPHLHFRQIYHSGVDARYQYLFKNSELDVLIDKLYTTLDQKKRVYVYQEIQRLFFENAVTVPLFFEDHITLYNNRLKNFEPVSGELNSLWQAYLSE